jgi:hypothetical protein
MLNKNYQNILQVATIVWAQESSKSELLVESYVVLKVNDLIVID